MVLPEDQWLEAAKRYRQKTDEETSKERDEESMAIREAAKALERFIRGPQGEAALELLKASGRRIVFASKQDAYGGTVWCLDGRGVSKYFFVDGIQKWNEVTAEAVVREAVQRGAKSPNEIISWIREMLNSIAASALGESRDPRTRAPGGDH